jgi:CheY-like chemotaxis protein/two-component sensor histidine kinase
VQALSLLNGALRRTVKDDRSLEMVESMEHSLTAMTNLLNSLLDISRLDAGKVIPEIEEFPLQRIIDRLSQEFSRQAQHKGLVYTRCNCGATVRSDPNLLSEIIQNLVGNAIRYTDRGQVILRCVEDNGRCWLEVEDTGIGIDEAQLDEIFHEFHQIRSSRSSKEGFGLGLAIVKRLGDLLDHEINVESTLGKGSVFRVSMPITSGAVDPADNPDGDDDQDGQSGSGLVILIEDDMSIANAWGHLLEAEGYRVATAASANEARTLINHIDEQPALIISDFHLLDGSTGVEAVIDIREHFDSNIPAFIVTGDTSKVVKEAHTVENSTLLNKPVNTARLLAAARIATETGEVPED